MTNVPREMANYRKAVSIIAALNTFKDFNSVTPEEYELVNKVYENKSLDGINLIYSRLDAQYPEKYRVNSSEYMNLYKVLDRIKWGELYYDRHYRNKVSN